MTFVLRDALNYLGLLKETNIGNQQRLCAYKKELFESTAKQLSALIEN
jgi:hypothetical protein